METHDHNPLMSDFVPHKVCWLLREDIIVMHAFGDGLTVLAYYLIPITLLWMLYNYRFGIWMKCVFGVYSMFIFLCGTTHLMDVIMIWYINETMLLFDGWVRVFMGVFSMFAWGVTIFSAMNFKIVFEELLSIKEQISFYRKEFNSISPETINKLDKLMDNVEKQIEPITKSTKLDE